VRGLVRDFESASVSTLGAPLDDMQLDTLYEKYDKQLGEDTAKAIMAYYKQHVRGDKK